MPRFIHFSLDKSAAISKAVSGSFTGPKQTEIAAAEGGKSLALYRITENGRIIQLYHRECFGLIRNIAPFRLTGGNKDYLAVTSDSGRIVLLDWDVKTKSFVKLHQETFGKTGVRRVVVSEYLSVDPKGRAILLGAVERQKFVYIITRDVAGRLQIGSPLEAHKSHQICFDSCALDVGFENPVFVTLECSKESIDNSVQKETSKDNHEADVNQPPCPPKTLAFWEMDLGLNHVVKKCTLPADKTATGLIPVPAGIDFAEGPGGVLLCCENFLVFRKADHAEVAVALPRRLEVAPDTPVMIVCWTAHKMKDFYFVIIQTEYGDLYRVELVSEGQTLKKMVCRYFDTIPVATSLNILKTGYLFAALETGDHQVYQFLAIGNEDDATAIGVSSSDHPQGRNAVIPFKPRKLTNLLSIADWSSRAPMTDLRVIDCIGDTLFPQIYALSGSGPRGQLSVLRQGLAIEEMAASEVPGIPSGIWTVPDRYGAPYHSFILMSFPNVTLVLKVTDSIEELSSSQFATNITTIHAACLCDGSHLQVTEDGWRLLQGDVNQEEHRPVTEWKVSIGKRVVAACSNDSQVLLALNSGLIVYFELQQTGSRSLVEMGSHDLGHEVTCISIQPPAPGTLRSSFAAVGGNDRSIKTLCLDRDKILFRTVSSYTLSSDTQADTLALVRIPYESSEIEESTGTTLFVGQNNGVLLRLQVDSQTGAIHMNQKRQKFLGSQSVRVVPVDVQIPMDLTLGESDGNEASASVYSGCMALSSKPWLAYSRCDKFRLSPLVSESVDLIASLNSVHCSYGFVAISGNTLRIIAVKIDVQDRIFSESRIGLDYTPKKLTVFPPPPTVQEQQEAQLKNMPILLLPPSAQRPWFLATIESDHNAFDLATRDQMREALDQIELPGQGGDGSIEKPAKPEFSEVGSYKAGEGKWGGCLRLINPSPLSVVKTIPFGPDEAPTCVAVCQFLEYPDHPALVVGTVTGLSLKSRKCLRGSLKVYVYDQNGELSLHHDTPLEDTPMALCAWSGRLLASVGHRIRIYTLGRKRLLKRCEYKVI